MNNKLAQKAVKAALSGDWQEAIDLNNQILENVPEDIDAMNRLARAHAAIGEKQAAIKLSKKVVSIEPLNSIANKCLQKWENLEDQNGSSDKPADASEFLEIPGKTKLIPLINLGDESIISQLGAADKVLLKAHNHRVCVYTRNEKYIGRLPDDIAARLKKLMEYGNEYSVYIKTSNEKSVIIFVKERKRSKDLKNIPSFSSQKIDYISFKSADS